MEDGAYLHLSRSNAGLVLNLAGARSRDLNGTLAGGSDVLNDIATRGGSVGRDFGSELGVEEAI